MDFFPNPEPFTVYRRGNHVQRPRSMYRRNNRQNFVNTSGGVDITLIRQRIAELDAGIRQTGRGLDAALRDELGLEERLRIRRRARIDATRSPTRSIYEAPVTRHRRHFPDTKQGMRLIRDEPLTHADLWVDGAGPRVQVAEKPHEKCSICCHVKSHPVSYICGHSHCYVCIRLWLERDWKCPDCATTMYQAPFRQYAEEDALEATYSDWDSSRVEYNWDGLLFPKIPKPAVVVVDSEPERARIDMPRHRADIVDVGVGNDAVAPSGDLGVYVSSDGQRRQEEMLNISHKKRQLNDSLAQWKPVLEEGYSQMEDHYASSDDPASLWRPKKAFFLDELIRHDGLGHDIHSPQCAHCQKEYNKPADVQKRPAGMHIFKCGDCGQFLQCQSCCLSHHALTPLHVIKEWNGDFWIDATLAQIGLIYQLGHGGFPCIVPDKHIYKMTVIEAPVIHQIHICYCACSKSDHADPLEQLLRNAWYPATCATFKTLDAF
ncbi:hypothetical protein C8R43DRAFT_1125753 [Mycena crocata]|nr:hypothetical protein C8R43DRAFT_1125753 [Mycena crocata]